MQDQFSEGLESRSIVKIKKIGTSENIADVLTKSLRLGSFAHFMKYLSDFGSFSRKYVRGRENISKAKTKAKRSKGIAKEDEVLNLLAVELFEMEYIKGKVI